MLATLITGIVSILAFIGIAAYKTGRSVFD